MIFHSAPFCLTSSTHPVVNVLLPKEYISPPATLESESPDEDADVLINSFTCSSLVPSYVVPVRLNALSVPLGRSLRLGAIGRRLPLARPPMTGISYVVARHIYNMTSYRIRKAQGPMVKVPRIIYQ